MTRLTERQALEICVLRAIEQAPDNGGLWTPADAREATRQAADLLGRGADFAALLSRRAQWALERMARRTPEQAPRLRDSRLPAVLAWLLCGLALAAGAMTDQLTSRERVDAVEYGLLGLIAWNLLVYGAVIAGGVAALARRGRAASRLERTVSGWYFQRALGGSPDRGRAWWAACRAQWAGVAQALSGARCAMLLHAAAMCFAVGLLAMLYVRGLPRSYQPGVHASTWLDLDTTRRLFEFIVAPGAWLFGLPIPDIHAIEQGAGTPQALALSRRLFHLHAASVVVWVLLPRSLLLAWQALQWWRLRRNLALPLRAAYFTALRAGWRDQRIAVVVVPFRYDMTPPVQARLQRLLERTYGMAVEISVLRSVLMGDDPSDWRRALRSEGQVAVLPVFNLAATAEPAVHGALVKQLCAAVEPETPVLPVVDTSAIPPGNEARLDARRRQWRQVLDRLRIEPLFLDLGRDDAENLRAVQDRLNRHD